MLRHAAGLTTYRYQYAGNWSNQDPLPWMGAFHSSDLVMLFGAYTDGEGPCCEPLEAQTSATMQDYILSFMRDPYNGPPSMGWYPMDPTEADGGTLLRFGADGKAAQNATGYDFEGVCFGEYRIVPAFQWCADPSVQVRTLTTRSRDSPEQQDDTARLQLNAALWMSQRAETRSAFQGLGQW